jgi:predicted transcriptional regulator
MAAREPITLELDPEIVSLAREHAAASGRSEADVFEDAVGAYVALETVERVRARLGLSAEEGDRVAYGELRAARAERQGQ